MRAPIDFPKPQFPKPIFPPKHIDPSLGDKINFGFKDKDGSGTLDRDEYVSTKGTSLQAKLERLKQNAEFERYDTNGDGKLTEQEYLRGRQADRWGQIFHQPIFKKVFDAPVKALQAAFDK